MRRLPLLLAAATAAFGLRTALARAASLHFQAVPTAQTAICPAPCYELRMFYEDPTGSLEIHLLQFDVAVQGASVALLPSGPPSPTNSNVEGPNVAVVIGEENLFLFPFSLTGGLARSPDAPFDARIVNGATLPFSIESTLAIRNTADFCGPARRCAIQLDGLLANRIYLGRFNVFAPGPEVFASVGRMSGRGPGFDDPVLGVARLDGAVLPVEVLPEPASVLLGVAALCALGAARGPAANRARRAAGG